MTEPRTSLSVLVVEDSADTAGSTAELLALAGHHARVAHSGEEALLAVEGEMPDVVLLDIDLPGMDGWEVAERLRDQARGKPPVVVAVTGYGADRDRSRSADAGIDLHLVKPVHPAVLVGLLKRVGRALAPPHPCG